MDKIEANRIIAGYMGHEANPAIRETACVSGEPYPPLPDFISLDALIPVWERRCKGTKFCVYEYMRNSLSLRLESLEWENAATFKEAMAIATAQDIQFKHK